MLEKGFYCLLDECEQLMVRVTNYFLQNDVEHLTLLHLKKVLSVSTYQAKLACDQLTAIADKIDNDEAFGFSFDKENGLTFHNVTTQTLELLTLILAYNSLNIQILLNDGLGIGGSRDTFLKKAGISQSTYYRCKKKMFRDLQEEFPDQKMTNEIENRALLQHITFFFFGSDQFPMINLSKQLHNTLNFLIFNWQLDPTYTEKKELAHFVAVQLLRIKNKQRILTEEDDLLTHPFGKHFERTQEYLMRNLGLTEKQAYHEALFFNAYIIIYDGSPLSKQSLLKRKKEIDRLTNQQLTIIENNLNVHDCRREFPNFVKELTKLNTQTLSPFFFINSYLDHQTTFEVMRSYPMTENLAHKFINLRKQIKLPFLSEYSALQLLYQYSILIVTDLPADVIDDQLHIVADFSLGRIYSQFIQQQLSRLVNANIVIDPKINRQTDLFISDKFNAGIKVKQITWNCPPTKQDWQKLRSTIVDMHTKKIN